MPGFLGKQNFSDVMSLTTISILDFGCVGYLQGRDLPVIGQSLFPLKQSWEIKVKSNWRSSIGLQESSGIGEIYYKLNYHNQKIPQALHATYGNAGQLFRPY